MEEDQQEEWIKKRAEEVLPGFLLKINKHIDTNYMKHGWAATKELSIADVVLLAWISSIIFNPYYPDREKLLKNPDLSHLKLYWE